MDFSVDSANPLASTEFNKVGNVGLAFTSQEQAVPTHYNEIGLDPSAAEKLGQQDFNDTVAPVESGWDGLATSSLSTVLQALPARERFNGGFFDKAAEDSSSDLLLGTHGAGVFSREGYQAISIPVEQDSIAPNAPSNNYSPSPWFREMGDNTFKGALFQSITGLDQRIYTRLSENGQSWSSWKESGGLTNSRPNIEEFNGKLFQTVRGLGNSIHIRSSSDGVNWSPWENTGGRTLDAPDIKAFNGKLYQTVQGTDNGIYIRSSADGTTWTGWKSSGGAASSGPALEVFKNRLYQTVRGTNDLVYVRSSADGENWTGWQYTGGATSASPDLEVFKDRLYQTVKGASNNLIYLRSTADGTNWTPWTQFGGTTKDAPQLSVFQGRLHQTVIGETTDLVYSRSTADGATWTAWGQQGFPSLDQVTYDKTLTAASRNDFNGDGKADLVWRQKDGTVAFWYMDGSNVIAQPHARKAGLDWKLQGAGDFNRDGKSDLVWQQDNGQVAFWYMDGATVLAQPHIKNPGVEWRVHETGDFNGDGKFDIALRHRDNGSISIWHMDGTQILDTVSIQSPGQDWQIKGAGDFNRDGKSDFVLRREDGTVAFGYVDGSQPLDISVIRKAGMDWKIQGTGDFNADGNLDLIWRDKNGTVALWHMNGEQLFAAPHIRKAGLDWNIVNGGENTDLFIQDRLTKGVELTDRNKNDFNKDGKSDLLFRDSDGNVIVWLSNDHTQRANIGKIGGNYQFQGTGDFNGDGYLDVLWRRNTGEVDVWHMKGLQFSESVNYGGHRPQDGEVKAIADIDGDGKDDIVWQQSNNQIVAWYEIDHTQRQVLGTVQPGQTLEGAGDFNGDSKVDLMLRRHTGEIDAWYLDRLPGSRNVDVSQPVQHGGHLSKEQVLGFADINQDGKIDTLWRTTDGTVSVWYDKHHAFRQNLGVVGEEWAFQGLGDLNKDGSTDLIWRKNTGEVYAWHMDKARFIESVVYGGYHSDVQMLTEAEPRRFNEQPQWGIWQTVVSGWNPVGNSQAPLAEVNKGWVGEDAIANLSLGSAKRADGKAGINANWGRQAVNNDSRLPSDFFAVRSYTQTYFDGGEYTFNMRADDGFQIFAKKHGSHEWQYITQEGVWDQAYGAHKSYKANLSAGTYDLHFQMYDAGGDAYVDLSWDKTNRYVAPSGGSATGTYFPELANLSDGQWDTYSGDNTRFDGARWPGEVDERSKTPSSIKQVYSDLSEAVVGRRYGMTAGYLYDQSYFNGYDKWHAGIDIGAPAGTNVRAVTSGTVAWTWYSPTNGAFISVKDASGKEWVYGHLQGISGFSRGQQISEGVSLGVVGNQSGARHLHLELRTAGQSTDGAHPNQYFVRDVTMSPLQEFWSLKSSKNGLISTQNENTSSRNSGAEGNSTSGNGGENSPLPLVSISSVRDVDDNDLDVKRGGQIRVTGKSNGNSLKFYLGDKELGGELTQLTDGSFDARLNIPRSLHLGNYELKVVAQNSSGQSRTLADSFIEVVHDSREIVDGVHDFKLTKVRGYDRLSTQDRMIQNKETWIVSHGWNSNSGGARLDLALAIDDFSYSDNIQVLTLDWSSKSDTGIGFLGGEAVGKLYDAAIWIDDAAEFVVNSLKSLGISGSKINFVGHSLGAYVGYEVAKNLNGINYLVALDPAVSTAGGYANRDNVDFHKYSNWSWGIHSSNFGSTSAANTADESFHFDFPWEDQKSAHSLPIEMWTYMLNNPNDQVGQYFGLDDLKKSTSTRLPSFNPWPTYSYTADYTDNLVIFEDTDSSLLGETWRPKRISGLLRM